MSSYKYNPCTRNLDLVGVDVNTLSRIDKLENTILRIHYYEEITTGLSGTITKPQGSTILLNTWANQTSALISEIVDNRPNYESGGIFVDVFGINGNYTLSGAIPTNPSAFIYVIEISLLNYNLYVDKSKVLEQVELTGDYADAISLSAGVTILPILTDLGTGSINVSSTEVNLFENTVHGDKLKNYYVSPITNQSLIDGEVNYVVVDYNNGTPIYNILSGGQLITINESDIVPVFTLYRNGNIISYINWDLLGSGLANKLHARFVKTDRFGYESGFDLTENGSRELYLSSGISWHGAVRNPLESVDSVLDVMTFWYPVAGIWTMSTETQYTNNQYSDGTNLQTLLPNKWTIISVYRTQANIKKIGIVVGNSYGSEADAVSSPLPEVPDQLTKLGVRVAKLVIQSGINTASQILSAFTQDESHPSISSFSTLKIGDVSNGNYTDIEADGSLSYKGDATIWDDLVGSLIASRLTSTSGKLNYNYDENTITMQSGGAPTNINDRLIFNHQKPHAAKTSSTFNLHIHWEQVSTNIIIWQIDYRIQHNDQLKTIAWTTVTANTTDDNVFSYPGSGTFNQITRLVDIDWSTAALSSTLQFRLTRIDVTTGDIEATFVDGHVEYDSDGSRQEFIK